MPLLLGGHPLPAFRGVSHHTDIPQLWVLDYLVTENGPGNYQVITGNYHYPGNYQVIGMFVCASCRALELPNETHEYAYIST